MNQHMRKRIQSMFLRDAIWAFGPPSHNPGNIAVYRGSAFPGWDGNLLIAMMNRTLVRMELAPDGHVVAQEAMLANLGQRLRDVEEPERVFEELSFTAPGTSVVTPRVCEALLGPSE